MSEIEKYHAPAAVGPMPFTRSNGQPMYDVRPQAGCPGRVLARAGGHWKGAA